MTVSALFLICMNFSLTANVVGMDGRRHNPILESIGAPLALVFVNHDCPICNTYAPEIARIASAFRGKVSVQLVYSEPDLTLALVKQHAKEFGLSTLPKWIDSSRRFATACGAKIVPEAVLFDVLGRRVWAGRIDNLYLSLGQRQSRATVHDLRDALSALSRGESPNPTGGTPVGCTILTPGTQ